MLYICGAGSRRCPAGPTTPPLFQTEPRKRKKGMVREKTAFQHSNLGGGRFWILFRGHLFFNLHLSLLGCHCGVLPNSASSPNYFLFLRVSHQKQRWRVQEFTAGLHLESYFHKDIKSGFGSRNGFNIT